MRLLPKLKSKWMIPVLALLAGGIYRALPKSPVSCESLQQFGAIENAGECIINKSVELKGQIDRLPDRLTVKGDLTITGTNIEALPASLIVEGNLFLYKTSISKLPADVQIRQSFDQYIGWGSPGVRCAAIPKTAIIKGRRRCFD